MTHRHFSCEGFMTHHKSQFLLNVNKNLMVLKAFVIYEASAITHSLNIQEFFILSLFIHFIFQWFWKRNKKKLHKIVVVEIKAKMFNRWKFSIFFSGAVCMRNMMLKWNKRTVLFMKTFLEHRKVFKKTFIIWLYTGISEQNGKWTSEMRKGKPVNDIHA
jgi:hypothetical protein